MTKTVEYTHHSNFDSEVLAEGWYNKDTHDLFLRLHKGNYVGYKNVPMKVWADLLYAPSAGAFWNRVVKTYVGQSGDVELKPLLPKKATFTQTPNSKFTVRASVDGTIELTLEAPDAASALRRANEAFAKLPLGEGSTVKIKELVQKFE